MHFYQAVLLCGDLRSLIEGEAAHAPQPVAPGAEGSMRDGAAQAVWSAATRYEDMLDALPARVAVVRKIKDSF